MRTNKKMELRDFLQMDDHRALEVGYLSQGMGNQSTKAESFRRLPRGDGQGKLG